MWAGISTNIQRAMCVQTQEMERASVGVLRLRLRCKGNLVQWAPEYPQSTHRKCRKKQQSVLSSQFSDQNQGPGLRG
jgi:hypothetical protein